MRSKILKNKINRHIFIKKNKFLNFLKFIIKNSNFPLNIKSKSLYNLYAIDKNKTITKKNNRCKISYRSRGVLSKYRMSRLTFKNLVSNGYVNGFKKASW